MADTNEKHSTSRMPAQAAAVKPSCRKWLTAAVCTIAGGWFGAQRFYLGRYASGVFRMALCAVAVYCGAMVTAANGALVWRLLRYAVSGAFLDALMMVVGPFLVQRRRVPIPFSRNATLSIRKGPVPNIDGTWLTYPLVAVYLLIFYVASHGLAGDAKLFHVGFIGAALFVGVYWVRDCVRVLYLRTLTDADGRLPG